MAQNDRLDIKTIREKLSGEKGQQYWRSLQEVAETDEFKEFLHREFPREASVWGEGLDRRRFLQVMGASLALAGLSACVKQPEEKIVPYVKQPEILVPGKPLYYSTAFVMSGYATGVVATSNMGRPTKLEGNPSHPASLGATDAFTQASLLTMYDPERSKVVLRNGNYSTWDTFWASIQNDLMVQDSLKGAGIRILTETLTSPTIGKQIQDLLKKYPAAKWYQYESANYDAVREGSKLAFGEYVQSIYHFDKADVVLSFDSDFLVQDPGAVRYAHDFAERRRVRQNKTDMNRLYSVESSPTLVGVMADHRLTTRASEIENIARTIAQQVGVSGVVPLRQIHDAQQQKVISAIVADLQKHRGTSVVVAGPHHSAQLHALVHAINVQLGNVGMTVTFVESPEVAPANHLESMKALTQEMTSGNVDMLFIIGGNPVYDAPADLNFAALLPKVKLSVHMGMYEDETSALCVWHLPESHFLESWGDARAFDGTASIIQPLIAPLYESRSVCEFLDQFIGGNENKGYDIVRNFWKSQTKSGNFDVLWEKSLNDGVIANTASAPKNVKLVSTSWQNTSSNNTSSGIEVIFRPDPTMWDGRFANNGWLQELPKPLTKLTWDNAALIAPATAQKLGVQNGDVVELHSQGRMVRAPIWIQPGHPAEAITLTLGYGRTKTGKVGSGTGFNANLIRTSTSMWHAENVEVRKTGETYPLSVTQEHFSMENRNLVIAGTIKEFVEKPDFTKELEDAPSPDQTLYPLYHYDGYAWGMSIDLSACTGCSACVIACQAENNIPVVGKEQVALSREMSWIRIDRYFKGDLDNPEVYFEPLPCMHCENAPCELVCPVGATMHDSEGLNVMVYNRCIGTRYCSNNCPYKVRRFNFLLFSDETTETYKMMRNPDVTVRARGVMEKCTYCIQRINEARITAEEEDRPIRDGEIVTACQQACPSNAIVFGNINDKKSAVAKLKAEPHNYSLLAELNTKPRTTYLAKLNNPNDALRHGA
jgi:MoCo/4Fe-4S cofactor protein with predicted Tat translocation signal